MTSGQAAANRRPRGPTDPERPHRIARAAITVIAEHGITGLTHRKVAAAAGVPLGSTTYYFATLDDLVAAALDEAASRSVAKLRTWEEALESDADLAVKLADFVITSVVQDREDTMAEYNLYALALHRPALRQAAVDWDDALTHVLQKRTDPVTGHMLGIFLCGVIMQAVLRNDLLTRADIEILIRRAIGD